jgi:hypothetical protein
MKPERARGVGAIAERESRGSSEMDELSEREEREGAGSRRAISPARVRAWVRAVTVDGVDEAGELSEKPYLQAVDERSTCSELAPIEKLRVHLKMQRTIPTHPGRSQKHTLVSKSPLVNSPSLSIFNTQSAPTLPATP